MTNKEQNASEKEIKNEAESKEDNNEENKSSVAEHSSDSVAEKDDSSKEEEPISDATRVKELAKALEDTKRRYLTALADYQNLQKRTTKEKAESRDRGVAEFLKKLLPVMDTLD
ncbi:MAG: nucleotide exchange factor GrpE, partial [Candidatus Riflebacteria bacterium]|nr:nucleotide exchange factor GrpE [Candidatus Riflebacteria bacterium]